MQVSKFSWDHTEVTDKHNKTRTYHDCKIWSCGDVFGSKEWDWRLTDTHHKPGVQIADAEELLNYGIDILILSRGVRLVLQVPDATIDYFRERGLTVYVLQSQTAVDKFNELSEAGKKVGLLLHSTC